MLTALSGDSELDFLVPAYPRILPELSWFGLDKSRLLAVGTLWGAIVPRTIGGVDLVSFFGQVDGTRVLDALLRDERGDPCEHRRFALLMLFSRGLLEENPSPAKHREGSPLPFLARVMDQTRVWNDRDEIAKQLEQPVLLVNAPARVVDALRQSGISVSTDLATMHASGLVVFFVANGVDQPMLTECRNAAVPALLISATDDVLKVGPMLLGRSTTSIDACVEIHGDGGSGLSGFWAAIVSNLVFLVHSRTTTMSLLNQYVRYEAGDDGIKTTQVQVTRGGSRTMLAAMPKDQLERLERQTHLASLPARYSGYKAYESHYSRRYIAAARQRPEVAASTGESHEAMLPSALVRILTETFGYRQNKDGELKRNCPTGGNLGSPEAVVVDYDVAQRKVRLLRHVPSTGRSELLSQAHWEPKAGEVARYIVVALGNKGKVKYKYKWLGDNVVQLDAGVAAGYFVNACRALTGKAPVIDIDVCAEPTADAWVSRRESTYVKTWQCVMPKTSLAEPRVLGEVRFRRFMNISHSRRAVRQLGPAQMSIDRLVGYLEKAKPLSHLAVAGDVFSHLRPLVFVNDGGISAAYRLGLSGARITAELAVGLSDNGELACQHQLSRAPAKIFFLVNLPLLLDQFGASGHDRALKLIGAWVGRLWLLLQASGLHACPAGAVAESDVVGQLTDIDAEQLFSLFCFNIGKWTPA